MIELPALEQTLVLTRADLEGKFPGGGVYRRRSVLAAVAYAQGQAEHALNGRIKWLADQILPDTCDEDLLIRRAARRGVPRISARAASGVITVTGLDESEIPAETTWKGPNNLVYQLDDGVVLDGTTAEVTVTCTTPGADSNLPEGATLTLVTPVAGVETNATVTEDGLAGGADIESIERLRARYLLRLRNPPRGGAEGDYVQWALAAHPDVDQVWVSRHMGANTITVLFTVVNGPIPAEQVVEAVDAYVRERKPATVVYATYAPTPLPVDYEIELTPDTPEVRAAVEAELRGLHAREAAPNSRLYLTHIRAAISGAAGEVDHDLAEPTADIVSDNGELQTVGTITWL